MRTAVWLFATIGSGRIIVELIKIALHRPRPLPVDRLVLVDSASFPSSHSAGAMLTGVALVMAFGRGPRWLGAAIGFAMAVGWSRIALGVHWPSDVLAGWGFGLLWVGGARLLADGKP
jgi:undecaprenyl-diphosphatase